MLRHLGEEIPPPDRSTVDRLTARLQAHIVLRQRAQGSKSAQPEAGPIRYMNRIAPDGNRPPQTGLHSGGGTQQ